MTSLAMINRMARSKDPETRERAVDLYIDYKKEKEIEAAIAAETQPVQTWRIVDRFDGPFSTREARTAAEALEPWTQDGDRVEATRTTNGVMIYEIITPDGGALDFYAVKIEARNTNGR